MKRFQEDPSAAVMILTLQSGGVGLTLTAASHVVHFDRCWNPAKEAQATDRAHRIGQQHIVTVHRLISLGTFEERLHKVLARKAALASEVIPQDKDMARALTDYSLDELRDLFALKCQPSPADGAKENR